MRIGIFTNDGGSLAKKRSRRYVRAAFPVALALFFLLGCGGYGRDPTDYGVGTRYYTITFNGNGNTAGSPPAPIKAADFSYITLPGQGNMANSGCTFEGWQTSIDYGERYGGGTPYKIDSRSITLYARWIAEVAEPGEFVDGRDGQTYKSVRIGSQTWMGENLNYETSSGSWCYADSAENCVKYGRLYDWNTAMSGASSSAANPSGVQGICPVGWHLPSSVEWATLVKSVGGRDSAGVALKAAEGWNSYNGVSGNGTDKYGFSALPGGYRYSYSSGGFREVGSYGYWWTATESGSSSAYYRYMYYDNGNVNESTLDRSNGMSVRCVQN